MKTPFSSRCYRKLSIRLAPILACLVMGASSLAGNIPVTSLIDGGPGSLRRAIQNANPGDTIVFQNLTGTIYLLGGELQIGVDLTITGPGAATLTIDGNNNSRVFDILPNNTVNISGLTIAHGLNQGPDGDPEFPPVETPTGSPGQGGGIMNLGTLTLTGCALTGSKAVGGQSFTSSASGGAGQGGGIFNGGTLTLVNCQLKANAANGGDFSDRTPGTQYVLGGAGQGGGIFSTGALVLVNCQLTLNAATGGYTGVEVVYGQGGDGQGGAIFSSGMLTLDNCQLTLNAANGGPIPSSYQSDINGVAGNGSGGGIFSSGPLTLDNCSVAVNWAYGGADDSQGGGTAGSGAGGGIFSQGPLAVMNCAIDYNLAFGGDAVLFGNQASGGGIFVAAGALTNTTIAGNAAVGSDYIQAFANGWDPDGGNSCGGGVFAAASGVTFISCTISANESIGGNSPPAAGGDASGGGIYAGTSTVILGNTIVSANTGAGGYGDAADGTTTGPDVYGSVNSSGFNLIGVADDSSGWLASGTGKDLTGSSASPIDPKLGRLQNNSGPTPTMALQPSSPAVNKGKSFHLTFDQRGATRPVEYPNVANAPGGDGSDIGAFELSPPSLITALHPGHFQVSWSENAPMPGTGGQFPAPMFGVQVAFPGDPGLPGNPLSLGAWTNLNSFVRPFGNLYVARDVIGPGPVFYELSTGISPYYIPGPTTLMASNITTTTATLCGTDIPVGSNTLYWFEYGLDTNYGSFSPTNSLPTSTNPASLTCPIYGLTASTNYHCQVVVADDWGVQYGGDTNFTAAAAPPPTPPVLVTLSASSITATSAVLNATIDAEGSQAVGLFQYGADTNYAGGHVGQYFTTSDGDVETYSYTLTGLTAGTTYDYQALGFNCCAEGFGAETNFTTAGVAPTPPALVTLTASSITATSAVLNATIDGEGSQGLGRFQYGTNTSYTGGIVGSYFTSLNNDVETYSYTLTGLTPNTTYDYQALGYNCCAEGFGANTNFTTAAETLPPPPLLSPGTNTPAGPVLTNLTPPFSWTAVSQAADYDLIISQSPYGSGNIVFTAGVGDGTSFQLPGGVLQAGTAYAWYMIAFDGYGDESAHSAPLYFQTPAAPLAVTGMATNIFTTNATMQGFVYPNGAYTTAWFEYGTNTSYGTTTTPTNIGTASQSFSATILNLDPRTVYYFRLDATNTVGTSQGSGTNFETSPF